MPAPLIFVSARFASNSYFSSTTLVVLFVVHLMIGFVSSARAQSSGPDSPLSKSLPRVEAFLQKSLGNPTIVVVAKDTKAALVRVGNKAAGALELDDDVFTWSIVIPATDLLQGQKVDLKRAESYLRSLFDLKKVLVEVTGDVSAKVFMNKDLGGDLEFDTAQGGTLEIIFFEGSLSSSIKSRSSKVVPVDSANSTFFARGGKVNVHDLPNADAPVSATLSEGQRVKVTAKIGDDGQPNGRWYRVDYADGKERFVLEADLLSEESQQTKQRYRALVRSYPQILQQIGTSKGKLAAYMGFYTLGRDCKLQPTQRKIVEGFEISGRAAQKVQDLVWGTTSWTLWSDGAFVFRADVETGRVDRFKPNFIRAAKYASAGSVEIFRFERIEPPGYDPDLEAVGFAADGKLLARMQFEGNGAKWITGTRCGNLAAVKDAVLEYYNNAPARLTAD